MRNHILVSNTDGVNDDAIIELMLEYCAELKAQWDLSKNLRTVCQWSFDQRESGRFIPYMSISQTEVKNKVVGLWAKPTNKQKELKKFFEQKLSDSVLCRFTIRMYLDDGLVFTEKLGKGNKKVLYKAELV